jgi:hypothetical protein
MSAATVVGDLLWRFCCARFAAYPFGARFSFETV